MSRCTRIQGILAGPFHHLPFAASQRANPNEVKS